MTNRNLQPGGEVTLYQTADGQVRLDVRLDRDTVWLTQAQMAELFGRERSVITKHINNVFNEGELDRDSVCANFAHTAEDGKTYSVQHLNLDVIISVGYRVRSHRQRRRHRGVARKVPMMEIRRHGEAGRDADAAACFYSEKRAGLDWRIIDSLLQYG